jgi:hypothetical protein
MNLFEKYKAIVQAQKKTPLPLVLDNRKSTEKDIYARIILNAITPIEEGLKKQPVPLVDIVEPAANVKTSWSPDVQSFIDWFLELETPTEPFDLEPHRHVIDPEKFFVSLQNEIAIGPSCPRNRNGALLCDLEILKKILH